MAILKCKMCGGDLNIIQASSTAECEYCGTLQTIPKADDDKKLQQFERANWLRRNCEFDKAAAVYEAVVAEFQQESEAYWGLVLCKYGIEYVDDPGTGKKIPTCHRSSFDCVMDDPNLEQAMDYADTAARRVYREESKQLEKLREGILEVSAGEEPYDIFICYKETDEKGDRTLDSVLAQDLYGALTDKGYRVFFSRITLQGRLGEMYEPYIFAALNSAKVMLAIGTDPEYYNAVWVKNEWSRYLKLCAADKNKHLIPCYKNLDAYDMPKEFRPLQGVDLGKMGAVQDILFNMEKYIPLKKAPEAVPQLQPVVAAVNPTTESFLKRAFMYLEDGNWQSADEYCEKVLDIDPENAHAYLGKLMAQLQVSKASLLAEQESHFVDNNNCQKALRFADDALRAELEGYIAAVRQRMEEAQRAWEAGVGKLQTLRKQYLRAQGSISAGSMFSAAVKADGTAIALGENDEAQCKVTTSQWRDVVAVSAGTTHCLGLKNDGTVIAAGMDWSLDGKCEVENWRDITAISAGAWHSVGLRSNGTVVVAGDNRFHQSEVGRWENMICVAAGWTHTVGVRADGTVAAAGKNDDGQCNVQTLRGIVSVSAGECHTVALRTDGTVAAVGNNKYGQCNVGQWSRIIAVSAGNVHTVGLRDDGTVVATGMNDDGQCQAAFWKNIIAISAGGWHTMGLKADGTVVATGVNNEGQCNLGSWRLFQNYANLAQENSAAILRQQQWYSAGLCRYCGGQFKGLFTLKCAVCGRTKDY